MSSLSEDSEYYTSRSPSEASVDTLEDLMRRFTLDFHPDCTLKLRHRWGAPRWRGRRK